MNRRNCINNPDKFCYICGKVIFLNQKSNITPFIKKTYKAYFGMHLGDQDKPFAPHICCKTCTVNLHRWNNKTLKSLNFGIPMIWIEGQNHVSDCYFCMVNLNG